jgi:hypothetical protein
MNSLATAMASATNNYDNADTALGPVHLLAPSLPLKTPKNHQSYSQIIN